MNKDRFKAIWNFDNSYINLPTFFYTKVNPDPVREPKIIKLNEDLAVSLGLDIKELNSEAGADIFAGNVFPMGSSPIAQSYAGHQFGHFTMLGDGRAILLGEHITPQENRLDIQLKGSGITPYSRGGDGRAVLGPMLREYIISEAMYGLGIPTTRSLAVVTTGERIPRANEDRGAILTRIASSHIRVGTFEYAYRFGSKVYLKELADYTIKRHYPELDNDENKYIKFYQEVIKRQASLIVKWQLVGFVHGVMNTDNMTISGETIDYGPCAFIDTYDVNAVFSSIDKQGRYAYGNQPQMAAWNLARLGEALLPLFDDNIDQALEIANQELNRYFDLYNSYWLEGMRKKLGIFNEEAKDEELIKALLKIMQTNQMDYTNTFIDLSFKKLNEDVFKSNVFINWYSQYQARLSRQNQTEELSFKLMKKHNPALIPRNYFVEEALNAVIKNDDYTYLNKLLKALKKPYAHSKKQLAYSSIPDNNNCKYQTYCGT